MPENTVANKNAEQVPGDGREGEDLERARRESGAGKIPDKRTKAERDAAADPHTEKNLDEGLDETFPASDPVSISPGAD